MCSCVALLIVDLWPYCVCCIRSGETQCTLFMVLYLSHMCQFWLHAVLWSHIGILTPPCRTSQFRWSFILHSVSMLNNLADPVFDVVGLAGFKSRANVFYWPKLLYPYYIVFYIFTFLFLSIGWYCEAVAFGLIGCISLSLSLTLPSSFNNNNYYLFCGYWKFCVVYFDTVSIKSITARYGGWLLESTG